MAQTPFQLLSALHFACLADLEAHLWLVDPLLLPLVQPCRESMLFAEVYSVGRNSTTAGARAATGLAGRAASAIRLAFIRSEIARFVQRSQPEVVVIFADNHEVLAAFAREAKSLSDARVVMGEEGVSSMLSYRRQRVSALHGAVRRVARIDNPCGYGVGWSPYVDAVIVSDRSLTHRHFTERREVYEYPLGPFPDAPVERFSQIVALNRMPCPNPERDVFVLGQPWSELGLLGTEEEAIFLRRLDNSEIAGRIQIKPHPFESLAKYSQLRSVHILDPSFRSVPAELLLITWRPRAVLSVFSSAALNYCVRYKRPGILLAGSWLPGDILRKIHLVSQRHSQLGIAHYRGDVADYLARSLDHTVPPSIPATSDRWRSTIARVLGGDSQRQISE